VVHLPFGPPVLHLDPPVLHLDPRCSIWTPGCSIWTHATWVLGVYAASATARGSKLRTDTWCGSRTQ
jgi:hypothetical protein